MTRYYCTYFDSHYLTRAVAMIESLRRHDPAQVVVYSVCHDELARLALDALRIPGVVAVPIHELETWDAELLAVKGNRTLVEYYWTCTPTIVLRLLERDPRIDVLTYVDADLCFYSDPSPIRDELGDGHVLIHEHRFSAATAHLQAVAGRFNVGLVAFRNSDPAHAVLHDWRRRCIAWCYREPEDGKIGDQGYLTDWPARFDGIRILQHPGAAVAPWNHDRYRPGVDAHGAPTVDGRPLIFFHYHAFDWLADGAFVPARHPVYRIDPVAALFYYAPYAEALADALQRVRSVLPDFRRGIAGESAPADVPLLTRADDACARPQHRRGAAAAGWAVWTPAPPATAAAPWVPPPRAADAAPAGAPATAAAPFSLTVATSIAPGGERKQQRAVASWRALGLTVLSFNNAAEIRALAPRYPEVRFIEVQRDGRARAGKPLVHVDDVFAWFRASGLPHGGFINSDIVLQPADPAGFLASVRANIDGAMLFSRRIEVENLDAPQGPFYRTGFDVWFWDARVLGAFDQPTDYLVGFPHWDYYAILMPLARGFPIRQFAYPFAFHEKHAMYYNVVRDGIPFGLKTFELVAPHFDRIPDKNHLLTPLLKYFIAHRPAAMQRQEDIDYFYAFLHALDTWFIDVIDRNSAKIRFAAAVPARGDAGVPFLDPAAYAALPAPAGDVLPAPATTTPTAATAAAPAEPPWWTVAQPVGTEDDLLLEFARRRPDLCATTRTLVVVGAHLYQERALFKRLFPNLQLTVLFEPIPDVARALLKIVDGDPAVKVLPYAIGDRDGVADFHVTDNLASSSLLPMKEHRTVFPWVHDLGTIQVQVRRLEGVLAEHGLPAPDMLFLDVQGAEHMVLASLGAPFRAAIPVIYTEASTAELYAGARTLDDLVALLQPHHAFKGFARLTNEVDNHGNAIFVRSDLDAPDAPPPAREPRRVAAPAAVRGHPRHAPALSVIVPTFNRAAILRRCLDHLATQSLAADRFEVIVVDDGSTDATAELLAAAATPYALVTERQPNLGPAAARNRALRRARADLVVFANDDALLGPEALAIHLAEHAQRDARAAVLGGFTMHPDFVRPGSPVAHCLDHSDLVFDYGRLVAGRPYGHDFFYTCNLSLRRDFVLRHGGFDEGFVRMGAEDIELGFRLQKDGCAIYYRPDCVALHAHRLTPQGLARMYEFRGRGGVHLFACAPDKAPPNYAAMPPARIDEIRAAHATLQPRLEALFEAIERLDALPFVATGMPTMALNEAAFGLAFHALWRWPAADLDRLLQALVGRVTAHRDRVAGAPAASLEAAAACLYPALQFVKWYHDLLGVVGSDELPAYLRGRQRIVAPAA